MASSVASNNQPSTEGQHGHGATQRQQISGVVHLEADGLFECRNNQAHNNHIGQCCSGWRLFTEGMFAYCSCSPPDVDRGPICSSVRSLTTESQVLPATRDGTWQETCLRRALILKIQKNCGFYLPRSKLSQRPSFCKNHCLDSFTCSPRPVQR